MQNIFLFYYYGSALIFGLNYVILENRFNY